VCSKRLHPAAAVPQVNHGTAHRTSIFPPTVERPSPLILCNAGPLKIQRIAPGCRLFVSRLMNYTEVVSWQHRVRVRLTNRVVDQQPDVALRGGVEAVTCSKVVPDSEGRRARRFAGSSHLGRHGHRMGMFACRTVFAT
jgi:hypothetical protein